jgi:predicted amidohydrolase YtcJ
LIELRPEEMVLPGLIDSHVHMLDAGLARQRCVLDEAKTPDQVLQIIADYSRDHPELS